MESFDWKSWKDGKFPLLESHSKAKLRVLSDYVEDYIRILCANSFGREAFKITLVDGFAGGGVYQDGMRGSPFVLLQAVEAAQSSINSTREKPLKIDCHYYFIEEDTGAFQCLKFELERSQYKRFLEKTIFVRNSAFHDAHAEIIAKAKERFKRGGSRVIFFLDQCGYSEVNPKLLRSISYQLNNKAEFIINYAVRWLADFISDTNKFHSAFSKLGLESELSANDLILAKQSGHDWRYVIEAKLGPAFSRVAGSPFFSPFYIEPVGNHRGYWLLHLAPHVRARSAMLDVYWRNANGHRHFGNAGLDMLAFRADADQTGYLEGMAFNDFTRKTAKKQLSTDFARIIHDHHKDGINFVRFKEMYCNQTIANGSLFEETLDNLVLDHEIIVKGAGGGEKRCGKILASDIILPNTQLFLPLSK